MTDIGRHQFQPIPGRDRCAECYQPASHSIHPVAYDVTAVSPEGQHVPLTAGSNITAATAIAQARSRDAHWAELQVRESVTGSLIARYRDGRELREVVTECMCGDLDALAAVMAEEGAQA